MPFYSIFRAPTWLQVAMTHPMAVTNCNIDMETLISDQNRSIATLAITTLLKTGNEGSVERLLKQVRFRSGCPGILVAYLPCCRLWSF